ncbi:hypothetical protein EJ110_NYTH31626 [Nymphaea thermarum]|nr:hypothetical protein EJ110_NYTH31626 [Nymphaea thermarum]
MGVGEAKEESSFKMYSFHRGVTFPYDHILFGEGPERSTYISLESKPLAPEWYQSWHLTFSRMFPSYIEESGLETVAARGMQTVDGNLVHAIAERWNPRTSSFWFPWGEMTILLDEFAEILDLPTPTCDPNEPLEKQFLMNPTKMHETVLSKAEDGFGAYTNWSDSRIRPQFSLMDGSWKHEFEIASKAPQKIGNSAGSNSQVPDFLLFDVPLDLTVRTLTAICT